MFVTLRPVKNVTSLYRENMYPIDRRHQAQHIYYILQSLRKTALFLQVSHTTISRWIKLPFLCRKTYDSSNRQTVSKTAKLVESIMIQNDPFISLFSMKIKIQELFGFSVSKELLRTIVARNRFSKKRARFYGCPKTLPKQTKEFLEKRDEYLRQGFRFCSLDETSFGRNGKLVKGYAPVGQFLVVRKARPRVTTQSTLVIISKDRILKRETLQGSYNKQRFLSFLESLDLPINTVILLDNVKFHHSKDVQEFANKKQWIFLYTPPYSPWFNPIEGVFSICKRHYYQHGDINKAFASVKSTHIESFFNKSLRIRSMPTS